MAAVEKMGDVQVMLAPHFPHIFVTNLGRTGSSGGKPLTGKRVMFENCASRVVIGSRTTGVRREDQMGDEVMWCSSQMTTPTMLDQRNPPQDQVIGGDAAGKCPGKYFGTNAVGQCTGGEPLAPEA